tara:strand:- start:4770 stop:5030 length:261 start_codon:yes stop_codon:yes gene_type:complete
MEDSELTLYIAQILLSLGIGVVGFFIKRLINKSDSLEKRLASLRERTIKLESQSENYNEKLIEVKQKLDSMDTNIMWIREKLASIQ